MLGDRLKVEKSIPDIPRLIDKPKKVSRQTAHSGFVFDA
jgi:hypothetical protein